MSIQELLEVVSPPAQPLEVGDDAAWQQVEEFMGTALPADYCDFGRHYGTGAFMDLRIFNPFSKEYVLQVLQMRFTIESLRDEPDYLYKAYPRKRGLLAWGKDDNGNMFCWQVIGSPDEWPVIVIDESWADGGFSRFDMPMTSFLAGVFSGELVCPAWSDGRIDTSEIRFEATPPPPQSSPEWRSLLDLYIENGNRADFWVVANVLKKSHAHHLHVRKVCGKAKGPLENLRFTKRLDAIVDMYDQEDGSVMCRGNDLMAIQPNNKQISQPTNVTLLKLPKWKSIYELYVENGNRAGFWIQEKTLLGSHERWLVVAIDGNADGPLTGKPPGFNEPSVTMHEVRRGELSARPRTLGGGGWLSRRRFARVDPPKDMNGWAWPGSYFSVWRRLWSRIRG